MRGKPRMFRVVQQQAHAFLHLLEQALRFARLGLLVLLAVLYRYERRGVRRAINANVSMAPVGIEPTCPFTGRGF